MRRAVFILLFGSLVPLITKAQFRENYDRYASAWVRSEKPDKQLPANLKSTGTQLLLVIPENDRFFEMPNGNRFLRAYLINNTSGKTIIYRADATVSSITTEILVDGEWKILQTHMASECGNSYWKKTLAPKRFLELDIDFMIDGLVEVQYRICYNTPGYKVTSNPVALKIKEELVRSAGTIPTYAESGF